MGDGAMIAPSVTRWTIVYGHGRMEMRNSGTIGELLSSSIMSRLTRITV